MTTNFNKTNLIMRRGDLNHNSGRLLTALVLLFSLSIGNAWSSTTYYSKVTTSQSPTGKGTVYVKAGSSFSGTATSDQQNVENNSTHTYSLEATPTTAGYYFVNWTSTGTATLSFNNANSASTTCTVSNCTSTESSRTTGNAQANWAEITINNGTASPATIAAEDNSTTSTANTCAITYATKGDAQNDFQAPSVGNATGNGTFTATWNSIASDGKATVDVKFVGDGKYGGKNKAAADRSRTSSAVVTLTSAVGNNKGTCTVNASFPNIIVSAGEAENISTIRTTSKSSSATFDVQWADDKDDFVPTFPAGDIAGGGAWTVDSWTYTATDAKSGTITVNYTFNPQGVVSTEHSAKLVLTANSNAGGASNYVVISAVSEALASNDASVTYNNNTTNYGKLADAIAAANSQPGAVVKLLRNIPVDNDHKLTDKLVITGVMTLDLNSYTIEATGMSSAFTQIFRVDATTAALTIMDSRTGGTISGVGDNANGLNGIVVNKGALNIQGGTISITNNNTGSNAKAHAIRVQDGSLVLMSGGTVNATTAGEQARGIYSTTKPANAQMVVVTGGTINTTAKAQSIGIECESNGVPESLDPDPEKANVILSGVTINAETTSAAEAYAVRTAAGVCLGIQNGTYNATSATTTATAFKSSGYTAVLGGTFNATATTTTACALHVTAGIAAIKGGNFTAIAETDLANGADIESDAKLLVYGGTLKGRLTKIAAGKYAIGANVKVGGTLEAQGGSFIGEAANTTLTAKQTSYACGVYGVDGNSTITMSNATMRGELQSHNLSNGDVSTWNGGAYGFYSRSTNPCGLTNCTITAVSAYQGGFGLRFANTPAEVRNCTVTVTTTYAYNYGVFVGGASCDVKVYNSKFTCTSGTTYAYGLYAYNGTTYAENCEFNATVNQSTATGVAESYLYGVKVNTGKTATLKDCKVTATGVAAYSKNGYGLYVDGSMDVENTEVTVSNINTGAYAIFNTANTGLINVASGKFKATATATGVAVNGDAAADKQKLYGGYYTTNNNLSKYLPEGYMVETLTAGTEFNAGYKYQVRPAVDLPDPVCKIGSVNYGTLEEALEFVNKNSGTANTIVMVKDYTLPAGNYTLPANATLLVPYKSDQTSAIGKSPNRVSTYTQPECYRRLILADGVNLIVNGTIEASAQMACTGQGNGKNGYTTGGYGLLQMLEGSKIVLNDGAKLMVWGFVAGERVSSTSYRRGSIEAKRGAKIYQGFQIADWKGGSAVMFGSLLNNAKNVKAFPINQYFAMNIEVPVLYRPGAEQYGATGVDVQGIRGVDEVPLVGLPKPNDLTHQALFLLEDVNVSEDTWIMEDYDPLTDRWIITMNSSAKIGSLNVNVSGYEINSKDYVLPLTHCMKLHMLSGDLTITQSTVFLPGVELEIDKEAEVIVNNDQTLYFVDQDSWGKIAGHAGDAYYQVPWYSPAWKTQGTGGAIPTGITQSNCPRYIADVASRPALPDALLNLHGKITVNGALHTSDGGANIFSSNEDAGTIKFVTAASDNGNLYFFWKLTGSSYSTKTVFTNSSDWTKSTVTTSAQLKNGDETYEPTAGTIAGKTWIYINDHWQCWEPDVCLTRDASNNPYAHPSDYVRLSSDEPDANHVYKAYGSDRYFIWDADCQWWEIDPSLIAGGEYKAIKADHNGKYNYYEYSASDKYWKIKKVTITWKNGTTTLGTYSNVGYKTHPRYLDATPAKTATTNEYYTWLGWTKGSETGEFFAKEAELPVATENTTYYAYFETTKFQYTITLKNYDESVLDAKRWNAGETPIYAYTPLKPSTTAKEYTFDGWATSKTGAKAYEITGLPTASAAATYYAHYAESDRNYTITWVNYDGTVLKEEPVAYNTTPSAPVTPTRPNDNYYTYTFEAWSPAIAAVTGDQTYTATYTYEKLVPKYTVTFKNGSVNVFSQTLKSGETPVFDGTEPTKAATAQYTYTFDGWSTTNGGALAYAPNATLPALNSDVTYYAHFASTTNTYSVYWRSEDGKTLLHTDNNVAYGDTPSYDGATPTKPRVGTTGYVHDGWSATVGGTKPNSLSAVTGDVSYYAHFALQYAVTFNMQGHGSAVAEQMITSGGKASQPSAPTETGYTFGGWYKEAACTNAWNFASDVVTAATTLYAKWTAVTYHLTYEGLNGATNSNPATSTIETATITLADPGTRTGYTFNGWTCGGSPITQIAIGSTGDKTIAANWAANSNTAYTVKHYKQNLDGTYPSEPTETDNLTGTTDAEVTPEVKSYTGFTAPEAQTVTILANGSRVVEYYYTRNSHKVTWDATTNGGSCETEYTMVKHGATIGTLPAATKTGHEFQGWYTTCSGDGNQITASTMITQAMTVYARFTPIAYTITYKDKGDAAFSGTSWASTQPTTHTYGTATTLVDPSKEGHDFNGWYTDAACTDQHKVTELGAEVYTTDITLYAKWTPIKYTITWLDYNGEPLDDPTITSSTEYGGEPAYPSLHHPERGEQNGRTYEWDGWSATQGGAKLESLPTVTGDATYYAHYRIVKIVVNSNDEITEVTNVDTTTVCSGALHVAANLTTTNLILQATPISSGEITGDGELTATNAYFDFSQQEGFKARTWYSVAVPWQVAVPHNAPTYTTPCDIYAKNGDGEFTQLKLGSTIDLIYYDGNERAQKGPGDDCWRYVEDDGFEQVMMPGKAYMFLLLNEADTLRFVRKGETGLLTETTNVALYDEQTSNEGKDANWNGIANPATYHAYLNGIQENPDDDIQGYIYMHDNEKGKGAYEQVDMKTYKFMVGQAAYVQAPKAKSITVLHTLSAPGQAPLRVKANSHHVRYDIHIGQEGVSSDHVVIRMDENKEENCYIIGKDIVKFGVSDFKPQLWIDRYDAKLGMNTMAPANNTAVYPLGVFVPQAGEYTITPDQSQITNGDILYLTYDGRIIWNLTYAPYSVSLEKGTNSHYGIKLVRSNIPAITTDIDQSAITNDKSQIQKVLMDDQVYILRGGEIYTTTGQKVK